MSLNKYDSQTKQLTPIAGGFDVAGIINDIGDLTDLDTSTKTDLVSAVNEVKGDIPTKTSDLTNDSGFVGLGETSSTAYAGDKGKANTSAIEAVVNEYGAKNLLPFDLAYIKALNTVGTWNNNSYTYDGTTFAVDETNKTISIEKSTQSEGNFVLFYLALNLDFGDTTIETVSSSPQTANGWTISDGNDIPTKTAHFGLTYDASDHTVYIFIRGNQILSSPVTIKPMIRDARITDPTYVPYAMTNRELTERVKTTTESGETTSNGIWALPKLSGYYLASVTLTVPNGGYFCTFSKYTSTLYAVFPLGYDLQGGTISFMKNTSVEAICTWIKE